MPKADSKMPFEAAKRRYVHRFTLEHVPAWAVAACLNGKYYAPQYRSDKEWYDNTLFPPDNPYSRRDCHSYRADMAVRYVAG